MTVQLNPDSQIGVLLAQRLGLKLPKREGHDLAGPCIACKSSDAFRLHQQTGVAQCYSCSAKWSPFQLAEHVLNDREQAKAVLVEMGVFRPANDAATESANATPPDPVGLIAKQKAIPRDSLVAYGAKVLSPSTIQLPAYGPDGKPCTTFRMSSTGGKGLFAKGKPAGLFFPHDGDAVRLPQAGETWHLAEGPKDAAALHGLGLLACGLNTCRLAAKFTRLFAGVHIILIPDRDNAGEEGSQHSARVLRGVADSIRIAALPAEFKESEGADVRNILRRPGGEQLVQQAIEDARLVHDEQQNTDNDTNGDLSESIEIPEDDPVTLTVSPSGKKSQRLIVVQHGDVSHRDQINTDSSISRDRFIKMLSAKLDIDFDTLNPLVNPKLTELADQADEHPGGSAANSDDGNQESQATMAANMATVWEMWHTPGGDAFATVPVGNHFETWPVKSRTFKRYVAKQFFEEQQKAINSDALSSAVNLMEAMALFDGDEHHVCVRVAEHNGNIYLDLCNPEWQVVEITPSGWQVIDEPPVRFRRSRGMLPLPAPEKGGTVDQMRSFLNVDDATWRLIVAWLLAALRPRGPYPMLALFGEQGSGKSTAGRLLRALVDPNAAPLRSEHRDARDLMIGASNSWCLAYDNLSYLRPWLSDALCRLSTGGGFATRELYTDQDEVIFDSQRPVLITSIEEVATRSDLLDRCLIVYLLSIPEDQRRREEEIHEQFTAVRPQILGALLDAVSGALRDLPSTQLAALPRMADFALWVTATEATLGWPAGTFMVAYHSNLKSANDLALESSPVASPLLELIEDQQGWSGPATELLNALNERVSDQVMRQKAWPKIGRSMAGHLKRLAPNLRRAGWEVEYDRNSSRRLWTITRMTQQDMCSAAENVVDSDDTGVQIDAVQRGSLFDDANDANLPSSQAVSESNSGSWEEGEL